MDQAFAETAILVSVKKERNAYTTLVENIPTGRAEKLLSQCKVRFGCGGALVRDARTPSIRLQGDQKFNIEKFKETLFAGMEIKMKDK